MPATAKTVCKWSPQAASARVAMSALVNVPSLVTTQNAIKSTLPETNPAAGNFAGPVKKSTRQESGFAIKAIFGKISGAVRFAESRQSEKNSEAIVKKAMNAKHSAADAWTAFLIAQKSIKTNITKRAKEGLSPTIRRKLAGLVEPSTEIVRRWREKNPERNRQHHKFAEPSARLEDGRIRFSHRVRVAGNR